MTKAMKAMKASSSKAMKAVPLKKGPNSGKGKNAKAAPLKKGNLAKLGQLSLKDKVKKIASENEDEVEAAMQLKEAMTAGEKSSAWQKHLGHLRKVGNEEEREQFESSSKKEKGLQTALYLMRTEAPKFCSLAKVASLEKAMTKSEEWLSEKEALEKWGKETLDKHIQSGRVVWRETSTWDVYEYCDTQAWKKTWTGKQGKNWMQAQEFQQHEDEEQDWDMLLDQDLMGFMADHSFGKGGHAPGKGSLAKGTGKGKSTNKGKGKEKGQLALQDMSEEEKLHEALGKMRKTRDLVASTLANYEEALEKVKKCGYLAKSALKEKEQVLKSLTSTLETLKQHLGKGEKNKLPKVMDVMVVAAKVVKDAKEEAKELLQISMKTQSKVSKHG